MPKEQDIIVPDIKLSAAQQQDLKNLDPLVTEARRSLKALRRLGLNVSVLEEKLDWADEVKKVLGEEFI